MSNPTTVMPSARTETPTNGSMTITEAQPQPNPVLRLSAPSGTLRLRAEPAERRHIQWAEDVVDNEGMGKKSSKVCCIYHKPREIGESSDESSSDSSSSDESDSEPDNSTARPTGGRRAGSGGHASRGRRRPHPHGHGAGDHEGHDSDCDDDHGEDGGSAPKKQRRQRRKPSPNAYEKMPKNQK